MNPVIAQLYANLMEDLVGVNWESDIKTEIIVSNQRPGQTLLVTQRKLHWHELELTSLTILLSLLCLFTPCHPSHNHHSISSLNCNSFQRRDQLHFWGEKKKLQTAPWASLSALMPHSRDSYRFRFFASFQLTCALPQNHVSRLTPLNERICKRSVNLPAYSTVFPHTVLCAFKTNNNQV